jgi:hypothetical protein
MSPWRWCVVALVGSALVAGTAGAQAADTTTKRTLLSINPLGIPLEYVTAEIEQAVSARASVGITGTYFGGFDSDASLASTDLKLRFYPNERVLNGFSLGLGVGALRASDQVIAECLPTTECRFEEKRRTWPTLAVYADYNWFLGRRRDFLVGIGAGMKRIIGDDDFDLVIPVIPSARFQVGFRF